MKTLTAALVFAAALTPGATIAAMQIGARAPVNDVWKPAVTPEGGIPWELLESTGETQRRDAQGIIYSKPVFTPAVKALAGTQVKVAGWMMPLDTSAMQKRFVLLAYPPGCPFHFHAMPNQFIEVIAPAGVPLNERDPLIITGTLQLTGQDESGIFYRLVAARRL